MKIAITGGTGFIGRHLARDLAGRGHQVVLIARGRYTRSQEIPAHANIAFTPADVTDRAALERALTGCAAVVDCAGTSREDGSQTFRQVHVDGARSLVTAARAAGVRRLVLVSYLRARPGVPSAYLTTKWEGEQVVRESGLEFVILKAGLVYGRGDHLLHNLSSLFRRMPVFATVGLREQNVRLVAVQDLVTVIRAALQDERLAGRTLAVVGPEEFPFSTAARRIAVTMGKPFLLVLPFPVFAQRLLAAVSGRMPRPLIAPAQVQMLADGISRPLPDSESLPADLTPSTPFTEEQIRNGLPE
jgi:NADH dehydrogenase